MHDDFLTPIWADHHGAFSTFFGDMLHQTRIAFERLAVRNFDAPWKRDMPLPTLRRLARPAPVIERLGSDHG
jgi:hypothetical protein